MLNFRFIISLLAAGGILFAALNFNPLTGGPLFDNTESFVLFADQEITLEQETQISSGDLGSNGKINIQKDNIINGNLFAKEITIDKDTRINGNASYNKLKLHKDFRILGVTTSPISLPVADLPETPDFPTGTQSLKITQNQTINPGDYDEIEVQPGISLILNPGTYNLNKLELKENSKLLYSASTTVNIKQTFSIGHRVLIAPNNNDISSTDLTVNIKPRTKPAASVFQNLLNNLLSRLKKPQLQITPRTFVFGERSFISAKLVAPDYQIILGKETTFRGQILAEKIRVGKDSILSLAPASYKIANPADIITDPDGGVYPINEILVSLEPGATFADAQRLADEINGRIIGVVGSINLYQIEIPATSIQELETLIDNLRERTDLKVDGVFRDFLIPIDI